MRHLFFREFNRFFSTLTGYLVASAFLLVSGLLLWVFPSQYNIIEAGYASLENYFHIAPWLLLILVSAITMGMFSNEYSNGTIELLLTKPLRIRHIVWAKFLASFTLVAICLLPTVVYLFSIYYMALPVGNIDMGVIVGAYLGLMFLAMIYTVIGIFASALVQNQVIALLLSISLCAFLYIGFDYLSYWFFFFTYWGIDFHYQSMSRGIINLVDVGYFITLLLFFGTLTTGIVTVKSK